MGYIYWIAKVFFCRGELKSLMDEIEANDIKYMKEALKEANKALKLNEVPVGAVLVKNGKILARAHNKRQTKMNSLYHAEILLIDKACKKLENFRLEDCEMYVTLEPCTMCAGAIIQSRIKRVCFGTRDEKYGAITGAENILKLNSNHRVVWSEGIMQKECSYIISDFFKQLRKEKEK